MTNELDIETDDDGQDLVEAKVPELPDCDFGDCPSPALYDFKTKYGPWAYGCATHYSLNRCFDILGMGKGQKLKVV